MKLVMATLSTAAFLALAGITPSAQAQDQNPKQQQDKQHPAKPQQQHPQEQQRPAQPSHPSQQQRQTQRPEQQPREQQPKQQVHQQQQQKTQQTQQRNQQKAQQQQQKTQQKQQRAQQKQQQQQQRTATHAHSTPSRTQRAQQTAPARGGQPERGNPQQTAHYEQAHFRHYEPARGERMVRIPDPQFREHFGRDHRFYIGAPVMVGGFPRFRYGGFWFVLEEPWPGYWAYGNDYYIMFTDGNYWLCDYDDPGVQIQVAVIAG